MKFLLRREDGLYVAWPGQKHSYTKSILNARIFEEVELEREKCGNETAIPLESVKPKGWH